MTKAVTYTGIAIVCLPMAFVCCLVATICFPQLDAITVHTPLRQTVASVVEDRAKWNEVSKFRRATRLDPANAKAWHSLCNNESDKTVTAQQNLTICETALKLDQTSQTYNALADAQEKLGDHCNAEENFRMASVSSGHSGTFYVESMGHSGLLCGDFLGARAALEAAIEQQSEAINHPDPDDDQEDIDEEKADRLQDQELLIVLFDRNHQPKLAHDTCTVAHPEWKACSCSLDGEGVVKCMQAPH